MLQCVGVFESEPSTKVLADLAGSVSALLPPEEQPQQHCNDQRGNDTHHNACIRRQQLCLKQSYRRLTPKAVNRGITVRPALQRKAEAWGGALPDASMLGAGGKPPAADTV